jgi:GNAT superfamily N-acetyltransferase
MVTVRPLSSSDSIVELTALLHRAYARLADMGLNYTAASQSPEVTAKRVKGGACFVAELGNEVVGTIVVQPTYSENHCQYFTKPGVACAHQFAVAPEHQGIGVGRLLLGRAEQWAEHEGFSELAMDTAEQAKHLIDLYCRLGYRHVSRVQWPGKVYESVVLSKPLTAMPNPSVKGTGLRPAPYVER